MAHVLLATSCVSTAGQKSCYTPPLSHLPRNMHHHNFPANSIATVELQQSPLAGPFKLCCRADIMLFRATSQQACTCPQRPLRPLRPLSCCTCKQQSNLQAYIEELRDKTVTVCKLCKGSDSILTQHADWVVTGFVTSSPPASAGNFI